MIFRAQYLIKVVDAKICFKEIGVICSQNHSIFLFGVAFQDFSQEIGYRRLMCLSKQKLVKIQHCAVLHGVANLTRT